MLPKWPAAVMAIQMFKVGDNKVRFLVGKTLLKCNRQLEIEIHRQRSGIAAITWDGVWKKRTPWGILCGTNGHKDLLELPVLIWVSWIHYGFLWHLKQQLMLMLETAWQCTLLQWVVSNLAAGPIMPNDVIWAASNLCDEAHGQEHWLLKVYRKKGART